MGRKVHELSPYCNGSGSRSSSTLRLPQHALIWSLITSPDSDFVCTRFPGPLPYINPLCTRRCLKHSPRAIADYCPVFCRSVFSCAPTNLPYWAVVGVTYFDISSHCSIPAAPQLRGSTALPARLEEPSSCGSERFIAVLAAATFFIRDSYRACSA